MDAAPQLHNQSAKVKVFSLCPVKCGKQQVSPEKRLHTGDEQAPSRDPEHDVRQQTPGSGSLPSICH